MLVPLARGLQQLLAKFEDFSDSSFCSYYRLPSIPDKFGRLPGQKRPKPLILHLPQLDPVRFPKLHNPEINGLAVDPYAEAKHQPVAVAVDDDAELTVSQKLAAALRKNSARVLDLFRQSTTVPRC